MSDSKGKKRGLQGLMIDACLGQLAEEEHRTLDQLCAQDHAAREERERLQSTIRALQSMPSLRASPEFRRILERRLSAELTREPAADRQPSAEPEANSARERTLDAATRWQISLRSRWLAFATAASVGICCLWFLQQSSATRPAGQDAVWSPVAAPQEKARAEEVRTAEQIVEAQLRPSSLDQVADHVPDFVVEARGDGADFEMRERLPATVSRPELPLPPSAVSPASKDLAIGKVREGAHERRMSPGSLPSTPAVRALAWLTEQQNEDGSWNPGQGDPALRAAVTALATLSCVAQLPADADDESAWAPCLEAARAGLRYLVGVQTSNGAIGLVPTADQTLFNQATSCLCLIESLTHHERSSALLARWEGADVDRLHAALMIGLQRLEDQFQQLLAHAGTGRSGYQLEGECAAWSALVLARARRAGTDFPFDPFSESEAREMVQRLQPGGPGRDASLAAGRAVHAMLAPVDLPAEEDAEWQKLVDRILFRPDLADSALRFLVGSAMVPWSESSHARKLELWQDFRLRLQASVLALQHPQHGYFVAPMQAGFRGGDVLDTALCLLTLEMLEF